MSSTVTIYYPFHPRVSKTLPVVASPRHAEGAYTVKDPAGFTLKVPVWMTEPTAANYQLSSTLSLSMTALKALGELLSLHGLRATLPSSQTHTGGQHAATQSLCGLRGHETSVPALGAPEGRAG
jgi:hypothetical protein